MKRLKHIFPGFINSIFTKLIVIFLVTLIFINIFVAIFFRLLISDSYQVSFHKNILEHIYYMIDDMGPDPDLEHGKYIVLKTSFDVFYKGKNRSWSTSDTKYTFDELKKSLIKQEKTKKRFNHGINHNVVQELNKKRQKQLIGYYQTLIKESSSSFKINEFKEQIKKLNRLPDIRFRLIKGETLVLYETQDESFIFLRESLFENNATRIILTLLSVLTVFMLIIFLLIRKILFPIKKLSRGVENVRSGNLDYRIIHTGNDELGKLTGAFNEMARELKELLHSKEQLLLDVSHELRSPLTRMNVALECLPETDMGKSIREDTREMETMITELLENARLSSHNSQLNRENILLDIFFTGLIKKSKEYQNRIIYSNISGIKSIMCDTEHLKVVIQNILNNSIKYSSDTKDPIAINVYEEKGEVLISIQDNGLGIPEEELPFIFEPFYRVDKSRSKKTGGYGLGLSLCKKIMETHNGRIEAESKIGEGTTLKLFFKQS